ncbi:MAG: ABC transporter permease [Eubacterium sp.]|nr:ABC transporter permease [Eubacterium sp.]
MFLISIAMFLIAPFTAWKIHSRVQGYKGQKSIGMFIAYFILLNACTFAVSEYRGIDMRQWNPFTTTMSYRIKYISFSTFLGVVSAGVLHSLSSRGMTLEEMIRYSTKFFHDMKKYFPYAVRAAKADLKAEVSNSLLDWLWWLIEPFCMMLIYTVMFGIVFDAAEPYFPVFIFIGITMWSFFTRGVTGSVEMVRANREIVTRIYLPKYILLFSKLMVNGFKMLVSFAVIAVMLVVFHVRITGNVLYFLPILLVLFLLTFGVGSILMHYGVYVNDLSYITGILLTMMMYLTGTFYAVAKQIPAPFGSVLERANPVAFLIAEMRNVVLYGQAPDWKLLLIWCGASILLIWIGVVTIYRNENAYVKVI